MKIKGFTMIGMVGIACGAVLALLLNFGYQKLAVPSSVSQPEAGAQLQPHERSKPPEPAAVQKAPPIERRTNPYPLGLPE